MTFGVMGGSSASTDFLVTNSLRMSEAVPTYLTRTPTVAGNQQKYTLSLWHKRGLILSGVDYQRILTTATLGDESFRFSTNNKFEYFTPGGGSVFATTTNLCLESDSWYHIVFVFDSTNAVSTQRLRVWVNNTERAFSGTLTLNTNSGINSTAGITRIGTSSPENIDGSIAELYLIDGQALTPSSFGRTDTNDEWVPKKYTGTYGNNGFYLNFSNTSSTTTIGYDYSGNGNHLTLGGGAPVSGLNSCASTDVPTGTSTIAANYCTLLADSFRGGSSFPNGAGMILPPSSQCAGSMGMFRGKWYWEVTSTGGTTTAGVRSEHSEILATTTIATGLTYGFTYDADSNILEYTTDGSTYTTIATTAYAYYTYVSTAAATTATVNHGQIPFTYSIRSGFKRLNAFNILDQSTIKNPATGFSRRRYTGTNSGSTVNTFFTPNLVIIQGDGATGVSQPMIIASTITGNGYYYFANTSAAIRNTGDTTDAGLSGVFSSTVNYASFVPAPGTAFRITTSGAASATVSSLTYNPLGAASLTPTTTLTFGDTDDGWFALTVPWTVTYLGTGYTNIFVGTNFYVTFGTGADDFSVTASVPNFPKIMISAEDGSIQRIYSGTEGTAPNRTYRIRSEGTNTVGGTVGSPTKVYEMVFYENTPTQIDLHVVLNPDITTAIANISFQSSGITVSGGGTKGYVDILSKIYEAWLFKNSAAHGIDVFSYTGNGANRTISHSLGVAPEMVIIKNRNNVGSRIVWHRGLTGTQYYTFDTIALTTDATAWNSTTPTSSVLSLGTLADVNASANTYDAYLFTSTTGIIKAGSYVGNGASSGPFIACGFRPGLVLIRARNASGTTWVFHGPSLEMSVNSNFYSGTTYMYSTGFKISSTTSIVNTFGVNYDYIAFAEAPPTTAKSR